MERKTVKIENKDNKRTGFAIIAEDDFDEKKHKLFSESKPEKAEKESEPVQAKKQKAKKGAE